MFSIIRKLFPSRNERLVKSFFRLVNRTNEQENLLLGLSDEQLRQKTEEFRQRLKEGWSLDDVLPEAFALVREASRRTTKMRHFDVQLIGGMVLHQGKIAEMATGEGKTLVATLPAYLNALTGKPVHIITVNDYLARRDREWMGPIYELLGLTVGVIQNQMDNAERKIAYNCDIVYGTNNEFGFDYLRDNMKIRLEDQAQRGYSYAIVDEVDSILIDEARTPLIISGPAEESTNKYYIAERITKQLKKGIDYTVKEKEHSVILTEAGIERAQSLVGVDTFYTGKNMEWPHHIEQALRAKELYRLDKDYIVKDDEVLIVDEFTGRLMPGRRWSDGLHQAVEAKENIKIKEENQTLATITLQNYFRMYQKLAGMTGTALTEAMEFYSIYKLEVVTIPTNRTLIRYTSPDMVFRTEEEKFNAIEEEIVRVNQTGRPNLVGTTSIENSERISERLKRRGIKHEVLNAKHHEREAQIIAKAGQHSAVTIATNMAGRGTDIVLGDGVAKLGGLHILGTERHEARRIDNQLRGRAGRQGDPGSSQFILSMSDHLLRLFAPPWVSQLLLKLGMSEGQPIESRMVSSAIEKAQKRMEAHNFDIRKNLLDYDKVMNEQRTLIYSQRQKILKNEGLKEMVKEMLKDALYNIIDRFLPEGSKDWDAQALSDFLKIKFSISVSAQEIMAEQNNLESLEDKIIERVEKAYQEREEKLGADYMRNIERFLLLEKIDEKWKNHLYAMDYLRSGIGLRGYAQADPKIEYKREGYRLFDEMLSSIKSEVSELIFKIAPIKELEEQLARIWKISEVSHQEIGSFEGVSSKGVDKAGAPARAQDRAGLSPPQERPKTIIGHSKEVGRNDPCSCGSGKKYKKCCGVR
ncbi:MAG: preprotein translocase subunit SecA [Planctomycetota bacterium]|nr:preprotein translocase subunit SecA [Planctomycetota bacterium]MDI6787404.1 preprotein translocase subunit SecA [Planctomycetota bacterium]